MKQEFVSKYDVKLNSLDIANPLTIGNGNFAFTCDITGLQTFSNLYKAIPLCTMSNEIWAEREAVGEVPYQTYKKASDGSKVCYMTDTKGKDYQQFRDDVFKFNLFRLVFLYKGKVLDVSKLSSVSQHLSLYDGKIVSIFSYQGERVEVETKIPQSHNNIQIHVFTKLRDLAIQILFYEPSSSITGVLESPQPAICEKNHFVRESDSVKYSIYFKTNLERAQDVFFIKETSCILFSLDQDFEDDNDMHTYFEAAKSIDTKDDELNRRMVLSLYLMKVNTLGIYPPAETGLTCNSWYGKFHLEMHLWHHLGLIRFGLYSYVIPSLRWYLSLYESARRRALEQGYQGIRLPKMTDYRGIDTPSNIGCLLIWQMPHLLLMLDEIVKQDETIIQVEEYLPLIIGLIDFMVSFYYEKDGFYHLDSPLIPANENVEWSCDTPIFEECYTIHAFEIFKEWIKKYNIYCDVSKINDIIERHVPLEIKDNCYEAYIGCKDTYSKYNHDHPMMIGMYSYFKSSIVQKKFIKNTLHKILNDWSLDDTWGWDFPMLAMCAENIGDHALAISILKMNALKNGYLKNGHNPQLPKKALPLYLPGNGAFLLAISHMFEEE